MSKVILISGASSGMGKAAALKLIEDGHIVYGAARRIEKMQDIVEAGGHALKLDITDINSIKQVVQQIKDEQGRIDILFNNAGYAVYGAVEDVSIDDARHQFEVNLFGLAALTQEVLPLMREQKSGRIINTTSMGGKIYTPLGAWYHATKHALEGWSDCLRLELKEFNIDVVIIEPGIIRTEFADVLFEPLLERSKNSAYKSLIEKMVKATKETYDKGQGSSPDVIVNLVRKAINAKKPKTRYVAGAMARELMFIRQYFGDRIYDKLIMSQFK